MSAEDVLFTEQVGSGGHLGIITLNRSNALNALNHDMIRAMHVRLQQWANDKTIKAVVIRSASDRAFCAGGDLRVTYERYQAHDATLAHFFRDEYQLNRTIFHYPKPYIALLDGITMGGGVGISIHGSHRVATDKLVFAMPETGIGFFPDVGGTYFLPRLPGYLGYYLGLTGARLSVDDCLALGIVQHKVTSSALTHLVEALAQQPFGENADLTVTEVIMRFYEPVVASTLCASQQDLDQCFSQSTMIEIVKALTQSSHPICQAAALAINKKSPTSLLVTLLALQQGKQLDFDACMLQEYRLACHFLAGHDFMEGIRAVIIDKDHTPKWNPAALAEVNLALAKEYFLPMAADLT